MSLQYARDASVIQVKPPSWNKHYAGEVDSCSVTYQGAQYLMKGFLDGLTEYTTLAYTDEQGNSLTDSGMFLIDWTTDDSPILPTATLHYLGLRGGTATDAQATDDVTIQSASTTYTITDASSDNYNKAITLTITYRAPRTSYKWVTLTNPGTIPTHSTVRKAIPLTLFSADIITRSFSGMVDSSDEPTATISLSDATAVWNSFTGRTQTSSFGVHEAVPGLVYVCETTNDTVMSGS